MSTNQPRAQLREAAFGESAVPNMAALSRCCTADRRNYLLTAIVLGAGGSYGPAARLLRQLCHGGDAVQAGLALAALAAHRRQLGGHAVAKSLDGQALRRLDGIEGAAVDSDGLDFWGARADALIGLAADNLGLGHVRVAHRLLDQASAAAHCWRSRVRLAWVRAEHALAAGAARAALEHTERAIRVAGERGAARHVVKSRLVHAAALAATAATDSQARAAELAEHALLAARAAGWNSLVWPAGQLLAALEPEVEHWHRAEVTRELYAVLPGADPQLRRLARDSAWVPL